MGLLILPVNDLIIVVILRPIAYQSIPVKKINDLNVSMQITVLSFLCYYCSTDITVVRIARRFLLTISV